MRQQHLAEVAASVAKAPPAEVATATKAVIDLALVLRNEKKKRQRQKTCLKRVLFVSLSPDFLKTR